MQQIRYLSWLKVKSHGMELSKNTLFLLLKIDLLPDLMDGQMQVIQDNKVHFIVQLEEMFALEEQLLTHITNVAYMQDWKFQELTQKSCQDNGNFKLDQLLELKPVTISGLPDIFSINVLKNTIFQ